MCQDFQDQKYQKAGLAQWKVHTENGARFSVSLSRHKVALSPLSSLPSPVGRGGLCAPGHGLKMLCNDAGLTTEECNPFKAKTWIRVLPFPSCVILGMFLNFPMSQFSHLYIGNNNSTYLTVWLLLVVVVGRVIVKWVQPQETLRTLPAPEEELNVIMWVNIKRGNVSNRKDNTWHLTSSGGGGASRY